MSKGWIHSAQVAGLVCCLAGCGGGGDGSADAEAPAGGAGPADARAGRSAARRKASAAPV